MYFHSKSTIKRGAGCVVRGTCVTFQDPEWNFPGASPVARISATTQRMRGRIRFPGRYACNAISVRGKHGSIDHAQIVLTYAGIVFVLIKRSDVRGIFHRSGRTYGSQRSIQKGPRPKPISHYVLDRYSGFGFRPFEIISYNVAPPRFFREFDGRGAIFFYVSIM